MNLQSETDGMRFTPQMLLDYHVRRLGIQVEDIGVTQTVIVTWFTRVREFLTRSIHGEPLVNAPFRNATAGTSGSIPVTIVQCPVGAPGTIIQMEELIACGAKRFIGVGAAGSLQSDHPIGSLLIPDQCIRDEGTSRHYLNPEQAVYASEQLRNSLMESANAFGHSATTGWHWTTDAIYRESIDAIERHREAGVLGVDMETSAMYAVGLMRHVEVANVLAVSDELWHEWNPAFGSERLNAALNQACEIALSAVSRV